MADRSYRRLVAGLWVLLRSASTRSTAAEVEAAARDCVALLPAALAGEPHFLLQEHGGALFANGLRIRPDVASFAATAGMITLLQDNAVTELLVQPSAGVGDLVELARCWHRPGARTGLDAMLAAAGCAAIHVLHARDAEDFDGAPAPTAKAPSQLGAVFAMQRLVAALGPLGGLSPLRTRTVLQTVLHEALRRPDLVAPLMQPQPDLALATLAVRAGVLAVLTAEELGWDDARTIAAGQAALTGAGASPGDAALAEVVSAARTVAALLGPDGRVAAAIAALQSRDGLRQTVADAMLQAVQPGS